MGVTKCFCAEPEAVEAMIRGGIGYVADSRIENLMKIKTDLPKVLLRLPMISQLDLVVQEADMVLISEVKTIHLMNEAAKKIDKTMKIVLMFDLGDLREGIWYEENLDFVPELLELSHIDIFGIGVNLTCYGGIIPTKKHIDMLQEIKEKLEAYGANIRMVSGGNSSSLYLDDVTGINNLRIGEAILLGRETAFGNQIEGMYDDVFTLEAEVIEADYKPSHPVGDIGMDAFGNKPTFEDRGMIHRAILGVGKQDIDLDSIYIENNILGASSDHLMIEGTFEVGDIVSFKLGYGGLLAVATSPYVKKEVK
jgi:predicted amino acid racemase